MTDFFQGLKISEILSGSNDNLSRQADQLLFDVYASEGFTPKDVVQGQFISQNILRQGGKILVATEGERVIGVVVFVTQVSFFRKDARDDEAEFRLLAVDKGFRRKGVAQDLVTKCIQLAKEANAKKLVIATQKIKMTAAQDLYLKMGFKRTPARDRLNDMGVEFLVYELGILCDSDQA